MQIRFIHDLSEKTCSSPFFLGRYNSDKNQNFGQTNFLSQYASCKKTVTECLKSECTKKHRMEKYRRVSTLVLTKTEKNIRKTTGIYMLLKYNASSNLCYNRFPKFREDKKSTKHPAQIPEHPVDTDRDPENSEN